MKYSIEKSLAQLCLESSKKYGNRPALAMFSDGKISKKTTYKQLGAYAQKIGLLLREMGITEGERVLLLSENCPEWPITYFGIAFAGAVSVPLLTGFPAEQVENIADHAQISAVCISRTMAEKLALSENSMLLSKIPFIYIDTLTANGEESQTEITISSGGEEKRITLKNIEEDMNFSQRKPDDLATIIYTSGTSGNSKGVMLSGKNIISSAHSCLNYAKLTSRDRLISVLPLAHSYECSLGLLAPVISGASITYLDKPPSPSVLLPAVSIVRPSVMAAVPLLLEKIYHNAIAPKLQKNKLYKFPLTRPLAIRVAGRKLISALGGCIRFFGIGGAPLNPEVEKFLFRAKFPYAIGYGLTEAAPLVAGNSPNRSFLRASGTAPKGVSIRIAKCEEAEGEGEIQVRGPNIMLGYYNDIEKTKEVFTSDGWLRTGDLGCLDKKGRLFIRGRLKALILGPSGENIYPEEIEGLLGSSHLVEDALVYSGQKGELVALVRLTEAAKTAAGEIEYTLEDLRSWVNQKLSYFSRLSRIEIKHEPFEKTPTLKIKRYLYLLEKN